MSKGGKDRVTMLPGSLKPLLVEHLKAVKKLHEEDLRRGDGRVFLPYALARKYPQADREWGWQWIFPAPEFSVDPRSGSCSWPGTTSARCKSSWVIRAFGRR